MTIPSMRCTCGAERAAVEIATLSDHGGSQYIPGELLEPCRCPRCITCGRVLVEGRCDHIDCPLYGTLIPIPDTPGSDSA